MTESTFYLKNATGAIEPASAEAVMTAASQLAQDEIVRRGKELSPDDLKALIPALFAGRDHEFGAVAFMDSRMRLIEFRILAEGTLGAVSIHPREVAKIAIADGASGAVLMHNHPGNIAHPSTNDVRATLAMRKALWLFDIKVHDHWVITGSEVYSMEEHGLLDDGPQGLAAIKKAFGIG
jgi:DNA repair protein RadC